uniref:Uncharacterized protein n=1 Tax=Romanomermis culicivorax TaxID=13658 RepID=A0A915KW59_ROMCU
MRIVLVDEIYVTVKGHLYLLFSTERKGSSTACNFQPENPLSVGKDDCNFAANDSQLRPTEPNGNFRSLRLRSLDCIQFRSAPLEKAGINGP